MDCIIKYNNIEYTEKEFLSIIDKAKKNYAQGITVKKILVKEVTSRANNGISSIDYLDDILAFFEKHNLDTNNTSIQNALNQKALGKTDKDVASIELNYEDFPEAMYAWGNDNRGYEFDYDDHNYEEEWEQMNNDYIQEAKQTTTVEEALNKINDDDILLSFFRHFNDDIKNNEQVANLAISYNPENIHYVDINLPFYRDLALKAVTLRPQVYTYIQDDNTKNDLEIKGIYDNYIQEQAEKAETERLRIANLTPEELAALDDDYLDIPWSKTINNKIQGYYDVRSDKVVLITDNINVDEASKVGIHEIAHRGILRMAKELGGDKELFEILLNAKEQLMNKIPVLLKRTGHAKNSSKFENINIEIKNSQELDNFIMNNSSESIEKQIALMQQNKLIENNC